MDARTRLHLNGMGGTAYMTGPSSPIITSLNIVDCVHILGCHIVVMGTLYTQTDTRILSIRMIIYISACVCVCALC